MTMFEEKRNQDFAVFLRSMQTMVGQNQNHGFHSMLADFQRSKPPNFYQAVYPMEADDCLRTIEKKLEIACYEEQDKVPFATHYLEGPAAIWWDNAKIAWPTEENISWEKFKEQFRKYRIPTGVMKVK